jgi:hypothetical protein
VVKDRWNFQFNEFIDKLQLAAGHRAHRGGADP